MAEWLFERLNAIGGHADPQYSTTSTLNWMRALAILVSNGGFDAAALSARYSSVNRRSDNESADIDCLSSLLMSMHHLASIYALQGNEKPYDVVRAAIVSWYYTVYEAASAMTFAASGSSSETHSKTAKIWHSDIVSNGLSVFPFDTSTNTLVERDVKVDVQALRNGSEFKLIHTPTDSTEARGAIAGYLSGTADFERKKKTNAIKRSPEFKALGVDNFRTKKAQTIRDHWFGKGGVNFLTQAFRFRGKANYRDSIYLSYGTNRTDDVKQFLLDLGAVGCGFCQMSCCYMKQRVNAERWRDFKDDIERNCVVTLPRKIRL